MANGKTKEYSDGKSSSALEVGTRIAPKDEAWDFDVPSETMYSRDIGENIASSSGSNIRSSFIGMGFSPSLVNKVIDEKGEDDADLLLETLFTYSALQKTNSESSDSLDELFVDNNNGGLPPEFEGDSLPKQEPSIYNECNDDKRASLLMMNFSVVEVDFAVDKLGEDASIADLVDFIVAAQIAENSEKDADGPTRGVGEKNEDDNTEVLFGTMDTTLRLLEMGFSENEVSLVIEKFGSEHPISVLADFIFAGQIFDACAEDDKSSMSIGLLHAQTGRDCRSLGMRMVGGLKCCPDTYGIKSEEYSLGDISQLRHMEKEIRKGKRPKHEVRDDSRSFLGPICLEDKKPDLTGCSTPLQQREHHHMGEGPNRFGMAKLSRTNPCSSSDKMVAKPPYYFYGNVVDVPRSTWTKISKFLHGMEPEFVNTQFYSALNRKEGYMHNLPTENRFHILPKPAMTIEAAIPHTKKWWPSWDTRKQLNCISYETTGISQLCDRLGRILADSRGLISVEQKKDVLHHCWKWNLVWVGQYKVGPIEPEHLERILGYPLHHSQDGAVSLVERLHSLKQCFQTDTLGYHLSVLKPMFPGGLTVLSLYSGIGGAEISLHRLSIHLRAVVSVETSETKRRILQRWWQGTGQTGELVQIDDIQKLGSSKLESLINKFGRFDLVICQNPCMFSSTISKMVADGDSFDFSMFCEFVRVLQGARGIMERNS